MKKSALILVLAALLVIAPGCALGNGTAGVSRTPTPPAPNRQGPTETLATENRTVYSSNTVLEYNGIVYFTTNDNLYSFDGKTTKIAMKSITDNVPLYIDLFNNRLLYINNSTPKIYTRNIYNLDDATDEISFGNIFMGGQGSAYLGHVLVAEGHVFYKGQDEQLHRVTISGSNDVAIYKADTENLTYSHGYLYFLDKENNLCWVRSNGSLLLKLTKNPVDSYYISAAGVVYLFRKGACTTLNPKTLKEQSVGDFPDTKDYSLSVVGADERSIYFVKSYTGSRYELIRQPLSGGTASVLYQTSVLSGGSGGCFHPVLMDGWIYFYADQFCRIKTDGTGLQKMGPGLE